MSYLKLPLNFMNLVQSRNEKLQRHIKCTIEESIAQNIMMQITCRYGEVAGRPDFGSQIWELEFNQLVKIYEWEEVVRKSLLDSIRKYERRLNKVEVFISLSEVDDQISSMGKSQIRRQAIISVNGNIKDTDTPFHFDTTIYVSPLTQ